MVSAPWLQASTSRSMSTMHRLPHISELRNPSSFSPFHSRRKVFRIRASAVDGDHNPQKRNLVTAVIELPGTIWRQTLRPLSDFGFGRRSIWEGGVGLFIVSGAVLLAFSLVWLRGFHLRSRFNKYQAVFEFSQACGISLGTPVRIRGVTVGTVIRVNSSLKGVDAIAEIEDDKIVIPRNSLIEVNQSGLLMETLIDITPRDPLPNPTVGPLDPDCGKEGMIVCDREKMVGEQGVSLDALVGIFTRLGREMEEIGVSRSYALAEKVVTYMQEAQPLLAKVFGFSPSAPVTMYCDNRPTINIGTNLFHEGTNHIEIEAITEDVQPLLSDIRGGSLLKDVQSLTRSLVEATQDLRSLRASSILPENAEVLRQSINTLVLTLKNVEAISSDILDLTSNEKTKRDLKLLITSLSRLL